MTKQFLFKFESSSIPCDIINDKCKVVKFKQVNCIAVDEDSARIKAKLSEDYILVNTYYLNGYWDA